MQCLPSTDICLPAEIVFMVCSYLCKEDQLSLRFVPGILHCAATIEAFRSVRLKPDGRTPSKFRKIALSDTLRIWVKEVTIDTELDPDLPYLMVMEEFDVCQNFLQILPYLGLFNNLKYLHVRFSRFSGAYEYAPYESWYFRYMVLDIISHCAMGMWTPASRSKIYDTAPLGRDSMFGYIHNAPAISGDPLHIKELTISHLSDYNDPRLTRSEAWNKLLRLPTLVDLKLLVGEEHIGNQTSLSPERYEFFSALPSQWLTPDVVQKLQVLSLFYTDYWGLYPTIDLDQLGALPWLKTLALGRYVFTNKNQTDWVASLGKNNKSGGLEELYLDECCVLFQAKQYADLEAVLGTIPDQNVPIETTLYRRRWHHVLSEWRVGMKGLKKFVMGVGDWGCPFRTKAIRDNQMLPLTTDMEDDPPELLFGHNRHRFFTHPEPVNHDRGFITAYHSRRDKSKKIPMGTYLLGEGLRQRRRTQMEYACYNVRCEFQWFVGNQHGDYSDDIGWAPEEETRDLDDAAYALLMETIRDRLRS
ncbi:hypothetical protein F52700_2661 [Fusarium sp. NRRL 52700]|nr:hypothetical protein F52700_2661 [Fusarium sp. NRRL 52700]